MEVEVQELQDVFDFVAAHFALFETIAGGDRAVGQALRWAPSQQPLCLQIPPHAGVRGALRAGGGERHPQIVVMQLCG